MWQHYTNIRFILYIKNNKITGFTQKNSYVTVLL